MPVRSNRRYLRELARAAAGATLFAFPLMMTSEMWQLGFTADRLRLALFVAVGLVLLYGLARRVGFARETRRLDDLLDALSAFATGLVVAAVLLTLFGVLRRPLQADEIAGMLAAQAFPAGLGAVLARKQLHAGRGEDGEERSQSYGGEMFLMLSGALFIAFNVAPTDEVAQIAYLMTPWHGAILALLSVALMHALVYGVELRGQKPWPEKHGAVAVFVRYSLAGYGLALLVGIYILWTFGRTDGTGPTEIAMMTVVLGFPASLGAATARLVV